MYEYAPADTDLIADDLRPRPDAEAVLLDVAARFASEHGVPEWGDEPEARRASVRRAARRWPLLPATDGGDSTAEDEVYELLRDAVDARDRFPQLWSAATEDGVVGGHALRQLVRQHRDKPRSESLGIDADQAAVLRSEPGLWHAVFRASRFLGRLHERGMSDEQILALLDEHLQVEPAADLQAC